MDFDLAFSLLLTHEGGYSNHKQDPGGKTRFGITESVARQNGYVGDMKDLPLLKAKHIYRVNYWEAVKADQLPDAIRYAVFDGAVNSGAAQSIKWLQKAAGTEEDGVLGPKTLAASQSVDLATLLSYRLEFMSALSTWPSFGRGWARRVAYILRMK